LFATLKALPGFGMANRDATPSELQVSRSSMFSGLPKRNPELKFATPSAFVTVKNTLPNLSFFSQRISIRGRPRRRASSPNKVSRNTRQHDQITNSGSPRRQVRKVEHDQQRKHNIDDRHEWITERPIRPVQFRAFLRITITAPTINA